MTLREAERQLRVARAELRQFERTAKADRPRMARELRQRLKAIRAADHADVTTKRAQIDAAQRDLKEWWERVRAERDRRRAVIDQLRAELSELRRRRRRDRPSARELRGEMVHRLSEVRRDLQARVAEAARTVAEIARVRRVPQRARGGRRAAELRLERSDLVARNLPDHLQGWWRDSRGAPWVRALLASKRAPDAIAEAIVERHEGDPDLLLAWQERQAVRMVKQMARGDDPF